MLATGVGLIGAGTHPRADEGDAEITDKERYERIRDLLGDAVATPVAGLHIHIGMPDAETAIRAFNGMRRHLPLLQALGANSPFRHGRDTGLASAREVSVRGWPRSGVPREMDGYEHFTETTRLLVQAADVPDYTWFWWKLRPHPRLGTVEVRALDAQSSLADVAALAALTHCLAREAACAEPRPGRRRRSSRRASSERLASEPRPPSPTSEAGSIRWPSSSTPLSTRRDRTPSIWAARASSRRSRATRARRRRRAPAGRPRGRRDRCPAARARRPDGDRDRLRPTRQAAPAPGYRC